MKPGTAMNRTRGAAFRGWTIPLVALVVLLGCSELSDSPTEPPAAPVELEVETQSLQLANSAREQAGVTPRLIQDRTLRDIARAHSRAMRDGGFVGHNGPGTKSLRSRLQSAGISYSKAGENLAKVVSLNPANAAHDQLMGSSSHRSNILNPEFVRAGVGVARSADTYWITQIYIKP